VLLHHPDASKAAAARADLTSLARDPAQRLSALRVLIDDAFGRRDRSAAADLGQQLESAPGANFPDLLSAADAQMLSSPGHRPSPALSKRLEDLARLSPGSATAYVRWLLVQRRVDDAGRWVDSLPPTLANTQVAHTLRAAIAAFRPDWPALRRELAAGAWGPLTPAALDFAFSAHLIAENRQADLARKTWASALTEAQNSDASLGALVRLARLWNWSDGTRDALFATVRAFPQASENYPPLAALLRIRKESAALQEAFSLWKSAVPDLRAPRYNWALLSLLIAPSAIPNDAGRTMQELHALEPENAFYATGCALALCQLGKSREACAIVDALSDTDRKLAARAPYIAFIYASDHRVPEAQAALRRAPPLRNLLPEEAALVTQAAALCDG
jgi:hypothetical protein